MKAEYTTQEQAQQAQTTNQTTAQLTAEEYQTIKQIFERIGCDGLIDADGFFETFFAFSYNSFFTNQPQIVAILQAHAQKNSCPGEESRAINGFIRGLEIVNNVLLEMIEGAHNFKMLDKMTGYLFDAQYDYDINTNK